MVSNKRTIETRLLQVFVAVASRSGISAAAAELGIAKSAVSKQLESLEDQLQVRLFERTSRRVALTREGRALLPKAESILAELGQFMLDAEEGQSQISGTVRIAASPEFGAFLSEHFMPLLLQRYPALNVVMSLEYRRDDLHDPAFDLAFRLGNPGDDRVVARPLGEFSRQLVCSPGYYAANAVITPDDLPGVNALLFSARALTATWALQKVNTAEQREVAVTGNFAVQGFSALAAAAAAGLGVASLPPFVAAAGLQNGSLVPLLPGWQSPPVPVHIVYRAGMSRVGRIHAVIEAALAEVPPLLGSAPGCRISPASWLSSRR